VIETLNSIKDWIKRYQNVFFPFLAFFIPFVVRAIPELIMGSYVIGFDTMGYYVQNTLLWLHNGINWWGFLATSPLFYAFFVSIVAAGGPSVLVLKIVSPLLLGFLGLSIYQYSRRGLEWSPIKSVVPALLGTVYFVALRVSWDMLRTELGLIFLFFALTLLANRKNNSLKNYAFLSLAMLAVALSHQLVALIMFGIFGFTVAYKLFHKDFVRSIKLIVFSLPAVVFLVINYLINMNLALLPSGFLDYSVNSSSPLSTWNSFASYPSMLLSSGGFFLYCFLPLLPLAVLSFRRFGNYQLRSWLLLSLFLVLFPLAFVSPYRWVLLLMYPIAFYAAETLSRLKSIKWKHFKLTAQKIAIIYLVLSTSALSFGYIFMAPEKPFVYFDTSYVNKYVNEIPSSMLQNTISISDCQATENALQWFKNNVNSSAILLTHTAFYSWALLTLKENQVQNYAFDDPVNAANATAQEGYNQIYLIWWVNGRGWYGQPTLPSSFQAVYQSGEIAIYSYKSA